MSDSCDDQQALDRNEGRRRIEQEDNLINHRFSWMVGSQSFLLTAFVLTRLQFWTPIAVAVGTLSLWTWYTVYAFKIRATSQPG